MHYVIPSANILQRRRGRVTPTVHCLHNKILSGSETILHLVTTAALALLFLALFQILPGARLHALFSIGVYKSLVIYQLILDTL